MDVHRTVTEFFHEVVTDALRSQNVTPSASTEFYLVNLLSEFTDARRVDEEPLALKLAQVADASADARARGLREVGDTALYVAGFFADSLVRRLVDVDYYMAMGGSAYGQLSRLPGRGAAPELHREVFTELSDKFTRFVDVLQAVRAKTNFASSSNLVKQYQEWVRTGSEWLEKRLRATGLLSADAFSKGRVIH